MDPLLAQEEEYKARAERQKALRSLQEQNAINARNRRDLAASLAPMGEKVSAATALRLRLHSIAPVVPFTCKP